VQNWARKFLVGATGVLAGLAASGCAAANATAPAVQNTARSPNGIYKARVETRALSGALNGVWRLTLHGRGYTFNYTGRISKNVIISGNDVIAGHTITFRDHRGACAAKPGSGGCRYLACRKPATYTFKLAGRRLTFSRVRDPNSDCELPVVLANRFQRVGR
jgi:hypothetical protein